MRNVGALQDTSQSTEVSNLLSFRIRSSYTELQPSEEGGGVATENVNLPPAPERIFIERDIILKISYIPDDLGCVFTSQYVIDSSYHQYICRTKTLP